MIQGIIYWHTKNTNIPAFLDTRTQIQQQSRETKILFSIPCLDTFPISVFFSPFFNTMSQYKLILSPYPYFYSQ